MLWSFVNLCPPGINRWLRKSLANSQQTKKLICQHAPSPCTNTRRLLVPSTLFWLVIKFGVVAHISVSQIKKKRKESEGISGSCFSPILYHIPHMSLCSSTYRPHIPISHWKLNFHWDLSTIPKKLTHYDPVRFGFIQG